MPNKIFNTTFENSLRALLLLSLTENTTVDQLVLYDFISIYGKDFGVSESNLHGDNDFSFGEFASRRKVMPEALKSLVQSGLATVKNSEDGFRYSITASGRKMCASMSSGYSQEYREIAKTAIEKYHGMTEVELLEHVGGKSVDVLRR